MVKKDSSQCSYFKQEKDSHARLGANCQHGDFTLVRHSSALSSEWKDCLKLLNFGKCLDQESKMINYCNKYKYG